MKLRLPKNSGLLGSLFICCLLANNAFAQIEVEPTGALFTPENLISNVFLGDGVEVTDITYNGDDLAVGYFTNGMDDVGIDRGIVMASGFATTAATANTAGGTSGNTDGYSGDPYLNGLTTLGTNDVSFYSITFVPTADTLRFKYTFASEEYPEYACSSFNDVFGFFIYGPGINGPYNNNSVNIALVPDPADPTGLTFTDVPVAINNVNDAGNGPALCDYDYSMYYNDNFGSNTFTYDGFLDVFIAQAIVTPCEEYTIILAIADGGDSIFDSAVFLEAKSFGTGAIDVETQTVSLDGTITESCTEGFLSFAVAAPVEEDLYFDYTIFGTAENGVDYSTIPLDLFIAEGDSVVSLPVFAWEDGMVEGIETIGIDIQVDPCNRDTFYFFIRDNEIVPPDLGPDFTQCQTDTTQLNGTLDITLPPPPTFTNDTDMSIVTINNNNPPVPPPPPTTSPIQVFGVQPTTLTDGVIKRICIDVDHAWISDVDAFLVSPGGQFMELTTDNGAGGDDYTQTCFTPVATDPINFGQVGAPASAAPFTGDWQPEGFWEDLYDGDNPTNGIWTLQLKDDAGSPSGTLLGWSICFNPSYQINYSWTPSDGLSCDNCPDPLATPDTTTTYVLTATDTYGCEVYDSITIEVLEALPPPNIFCGNVTANSVEFNWAPIIGASGFEVSIDGGQTWMSPNPGPLSHIVNGLGLNEAVTILVRGLSNCDGFVDSLTCTTIDCTAPTLTVDNVVNVDCGGASNGSINVSAVGNFPPFEYNLNGQTTNDTGIFENLPGGTYTVFVTDIGGCGTSEQVVIIEPPLIESEGITIVNPSCNGGNEGEATVIVSGGSAPYDFMWSTNTADSIVTDLVVGDYYVTITDLNGCSIIDTVMVDQPPVVEVTTATDSVSCNGQANGTASVTAIGGTEPYTYLWDTGETTDIITNLNGGIYTVVVTDAQGCSEEVSIDVFEDSPIVLSGSVTDALCLGNSNGTATVVPSGGTGPYTYLWDDPLAQTTDTAIDLAQDDYTVIVTDVNGCSNTISLTVNEPSLLVATTVDVNDASCFGVNDGTISVETSGGVYPYTYSWNDNVAVTDSARFDLLPINYEITITDGNGCSQVVNATINSPTAIAIDFDMTSVACNTGTDGTATANPTGGTVPYQYQWDAGAGNQTTQTAIDLSMGTYNVIVTDANGCTFESTVDVDEPTALELTIGGNDVLCFGNNTGDIDLSTTGGTTPYTYSWIGPGGYTSTEEDPANLYAGIYDVIATDANGCTSTIQFEIEQPATGIMSSMSQPDTICFGATDGFASVTVNGGTGPFTYEWSTGASTATVNNLPDGVHYVTITDNGDCTFIDTAYVDARAPISVDLSQTSAFCFNGNDGTATIDAINYGGTAANINDFNISWSNGNNTASIDNAIGGQSYSVIVTDDLGCTGEATISIDNPAEIGSVVESVIDVSCNGGNDGTATVNGAGGTAPYTFVWDINAGAQTTQTATDLTPGDYNVTITDNNGCSTSIGLTVNEPMSINITFDTEAVLCPGDVNGSIEPTVIGGTAPYTYEWSNGSTESQLDEIWAGKHYLTITDANGCVEIDSTNVGSPPEMDVAIFAEPVSCHEAQDGSIDIDVTGGTPPLRYSLDGNEYNGSPMQIGLEAGDYPVYIRDANGCVFESQATVDSPPPLWVGAGDDVTIQVGDSTQLFGSHSNNQGGVTYTWLPPYEPSLYCYGTADTTLHCTSPWVHIFQTTTFELYAIDEMGCEARDEVTVTIEKYRPVHVATGFTPNGDGNNDLMIVHGRPGTQILSYRVYDRWGEMVFKAEDFEINDPLVGWNGFFKGQAANTGVYMWYVEARHIDGEIQGYYGNTTLLK